MKTKNAKLSRAEVITLLLFVYPIELLLFFLFCLGRLFGRIKVLNEKGMPQPKSLHKTILISNHPSMLDVFLVPILLYRYFLLSPLKRAPLVVVDRANFYNSIWFWPLKAVMVPVDRGNKRNQVASLLIMKNAIEQGRIVVIFPEGGRTFKGKDGEFLYGKNGAKIRRLKNGVSLLVRKTSAEVICVGIKGTDKMLPNSEKRLWTYIIPWAKVTINIGNPIKFAATATKEEITQALSDELLSLVGKIS